MPSAAVAATPFRAASMPRGVDAMRPPGTDAGRNGPTDAAEGGPKKDLPAGQPAK